MDKVSVRWARGIALAAITAVSAIGAQARVTPSAQAAPDAVKVAYVYNDNTALRDAFKTFLDMRGLPVTPVQLGNLSTFNFSAIDVIVVADDTGVISPTTWLGQASGASILINSNKPVVTLGNGAKFFDLYRGLDLGWLPSGYASQRGAQAVNPADALWRTPNPVELLSGDLTRLYYYPELSLALYNPTPSQVIRLGRNPNQPDYYSIAAQSVSGQFGPICHTQWGFRRGPSDMSPEGKSVFVNLLSNNPCTRGAFDRTDVSIQKSISSNPVTVGQPFTYTLAVANAGPAAAPNVQVKDVLPAGQVINGVTTSAGTCSVAVGTVTCKLGALPAGGAATIRIVAKATEAGGFSNTASVKGDYVDLKPDNDTSTAAASAANPPKFEALTYFPYQPLAALQAATLPGDLSIFGIEVTQGIQCFDTSKGLAGCADNSLPVVAKKDTTARIYLKYTGPGSSAANVPVRLHIFANGVEYVANTMGKATGAIDRGAKESADVYFNVNFNSDVPVSFYAVVDPNNVIAETNEGNNRLPAAGTFSMTFRKKRTLKIIGQRLRYQPSGYMGTQQAGGWAVNGGAADWVEAVLPIRNNGINYTVASGYKNWTTSLGNSDGQHALISNLNTFWLMQNALAWLFGSGAYTGADYVYGWAPNEGYSGGHADMPIYPHAGGLGVVGIGTDRTSDGDSNLDDPGGGALIFAHEMIHNYDVLHTNTADSCGSSDDDSTFPYASSNIQEFGFNPLTGKIYNPNTTHDVMSYCPGGGSKEGWIAPFTWNIMAGKLDAPGLSAQAVKSTQATGPMLVTAISVSNPDLGPQTARFDTANKVDADMPLLTPAPGPYALELRNISNTVLARVPFTVSFRSEYSAHAGEQHDQPGTPNPTAEASVQIITQWITGTARLVVLRDGVALTQRAISANAPQVQFTSPAAVVTWTAGTTETLSWTGADPDGDTLSYVLMYSHDGAQWELLAGGLTTTTFAVPVDAIKGGAAARFRVIANDGVLIGEDETDFPIKVPDKAPLAFISNPLSGGSVGIGELLVLQGFGQDFEDGTLPDVSLNWSDNISGALGSGPSLPINSLSPGWHRLTLTVTDSAGQRSSTSIDVYIGARVMLPVVRR